MKGRNTAEKHNQYLQELYNDVCDENNSLKLSLSVKEDKEHNEKILLNNQIVTNEKLREKVLQLESERKNKEECQKCLEYDAVNLRLHNIEQFAKTLEIEKMDIQELVLAKENVNLLLQQEVSNKLDNLYI